MLEEFSTVQAAVDAIGRGEVIIVVDAEDRENEGDFICAADREHESVAQWSWGLLLVDPSGYGG